MHRALMYALVRVQKTSNMWEPMEGEKVILGSSVSDALASAHAAAGETFGVWTLSDSLCMYESAKHRVRKQQPEFIALAVHGQRI